MPRSVNSQRVSPARRASTPSGQDQPKDRTNVTASSNRPIIPKIEMLVLKIRLMLSVSPSPSNLAT